VKTISTLGQQLLKLKENVDKEAGNFKEMVLGFIKSAEEEMQRFETMCKDLQLQCEESVEYLGEGYNF
jgi:hypothetical protein